MATPALVELRQVSKRFSKPLDLAEKLARSLGARVHEPIVHAVDRVDLRAPLKTSLRLQEAHAVVRSRVGFYDHDRYFAPDITAIQSLVESGAFHRFAPLFDSGKP